MFSSTSFMIWGPTFKSLIHFEFIFDYGVRKSSCLIILHVAVQFPQHRLQERQSLPSVYILTLCQIVCCVLSRFSRVGLFATPWTIAHQAPLSLGFSRQEYWSGLPCPPAGDPPDPEIRTVSYVSCLGRHVLCQQRHLGSPRLMDRVCVSSLGTLSSVPLSCVPFFVPGSYCFDYCSFVREFEIRKHDTFRFVLLSQYCFGYSGSSVSPQKQFQFCERFHGHFYRNCIESVDCLGQQGQFNNISSNP